MTSFFSTIPFTGDTSGAQPRLFRTFLHPGSQALGGQKLFLSGHQLGSVEREKRLPPSHGLAGCVHVQVFDESGDLERHVRDSVLGRHDPADGPNGALQPPGPDVRVYHAERLLLRLGEVDGLTHESAGAVYLLSAPRLHERVFFGRHVHRACCVFLIAAAAGQRQQSGEGGKSDQHVSDR